MINDIVSDSSKVQQVKSEHEKGLAECLQKISQWEKFKVDYEKLNERLKTFPDKLSYDVVVPCGKKALIPGKYVNTNNITVLLGDNWFVEVSAKQACGIAERRIKQCEKMLEDLQKEKKQFEDWLGFISDVAEHNLVEINEEYDDEKEKAWREQHSKRLREHHQKMAEERLNLLGKEKDSKLENGDKDQEKSDDYYLNRLNELELEEEGDESSDDSSEDTSLESDTDKEGHLAQNHSHNENDPVVNVDQSTDGFRESMKAEEKSLESAVNIQSLEEDNVNHKDAVDTLSSNRNDGTEASESLTPESESVQVSITPDMSKKEESCTNSTVVCNGDQDKHSTSDKHVRWIDLSEAQSKKITFTHSKPVPVKHNNKKNRRRRNSSNSEPDEESLDDKTPPLINSPSDIYKCFSYSIQNSKPKSILKTMHSSSTESIMSSGEYSDSAANEDGNISPKKESSMSDDEKCSPPSQRLPLEKAFTGKVQEINGPENVTKPVRCHTRPKSIFKASRQGMRR